MVAPSTFNYCSLLDNHYGLTSSTWWHILPFLTLKIPVVTALIKAASRWRWTEAWDRQWLLSWGYREQQAPARTAGYDLIQHIHVSVGIFGTPRVPGFLLNTPLHMADLPQLCLRDHSPSQPMTEVTAVTKSNSPVKSTKFCPCMMSAATVLVESTLVWLGNKRFVLSCQLTWAKMLVNN